MPWTDPNPEMVSTDYFSLVIPILILEKFKECWIKMGTVDPSMIGKQEPFYPLSSITLGEIFLRITSKWNTNSNFRKVVYISIVYHNYHDPEYIYIYFWWPDSVSSFDSHVVTIEHRKVVTQPTYCTIHCPKKHNFKNIGLSQPFGSEQNQSGLQH